MALSAVQGGQLMLLPFWCKGARPVCDVCLFTFQANVDKDSAWAAAQQLQAAVSALATSSSDTGLRMVGIKMSEQAAILYTAPEALALPDAATLVTTADSLVKLLGELLKEPAVQQLPGPVIICCIKALGAVVMQRANMVHRGMPSLLALATKVKERTKHHLFAVVPGTSQNLLARGLTVVQRKEMQRKSASLLTAPVTYCKLFWLEAVATRAVLRVTWLFATRLTASGRPRCNIVIARKREAPHQPE